MKYRDIEVGSLYVLDFISGMRLHRMVVRVVDIGLRGCVTWEDPVNLRRGYLNSRSLLRKIEPEEME